MNLHYSFKKQNCEFAFHGEFVYSDNKPLLKQHIKPVLTAALCKKWLKYFDLNTINHIECYYYDSNGNEVIINQ